MRLILCFMAIASFCYAQKEVIRYPYSLLYKFDSNKFHEVSNNKKKKLYWNDHPIDSAGLESDGTTTNGREIIFYNMVKDVKTFFLVDEHGNLRRIGSTKSNKLFLTHGEVFTVKELSRLAADGQREFIEDLNIHKYLNNGELLSFTNLDSILNLTPSTSLSLFAIDKLRSGRYLVGLCDCYVDCTECKYYFLSSNGMEIRPGPFNSFQNSDSYKLFLIDQNEETLLLEISGGQSFENGYFIYSLDFDPITRCLEGCRNIIGTNFKNGQHVSQNLRSNLDDGSETIITYQYSLFLERSLYRIQTGEPLFEEDLRRCSAHDLDLIRNMVFAKYNYKFQSDFYQAYFNSYTFYWKSKFSGTEKERKPRLDNVDSLLTEVDKNNLAMVKQFADKKNN